MRVLSPLRRWGRQRAAQPGPPPPHPAQRHARCSGGPSARPGGGQPGRATVDAGQRVPLAVRVAVPTTVVTTSMFIDEAEAAGTIASAATKTKARIESLRLVILTKSPFERT